MFSFKSAQSVAQFNSMWLNLPSPYRLNLPLAGGKLSQETTFIYLFTYENHVFKSAYFRSKVIIPKDAPHPKTDVQI